MKLTTPTEVRRILRDIDAKPSKVLGQNFLIDGNIANIICDEAGISKGHKVLEVGPGLGALTEIILDRGAVVIAIEKDKKLAGHLTQWFADNRNLTLIRDDALNIDFNTYISSGYSAFVSNLPYSVGSRILVEIMEGAHIPEIMVVTVQREVADRMAASIGTKDYGLLSVVCQLYYEVNIRKDIRANCFFPRPAVTSSIVTLKRREKALADINNKKQLSQLLKWCFSQRRKKISTILKHHPDFSVLLAGMSSILEQIGIAADTRPDKITPEQFGKLAHVWTENSKKDT